MGANFVRCNLSGSQFENEDISGMNLNGAQLFNCKWKNIKVDELNKLDGHGSSVTQVSFSPDGTTLATSSWDKSIRLWDVKTGQQKSKLEGHTNTVLSVCFSPDGTTLASDSNDNSIRLWIVKIGQQQSKLNGHTSAVLSVCFSHNGTILASGSYDNFIRLWDVKTGQQQYKLDGHTSSVLSVCFSPDGTTLASGRHDNSIRLWEVKTGKEIQFTDKNYQNELAQLKRPLFQSNSLLKRVNTNITILLISQTPIFQAQGALVLQGEFVNYKGVDLRPLLISKGSCLLENFIELHYYQKYKYLMKNCQLSLHVVIFSIQLFVNTCYNLKVAKQNSIFRYFFNCYFMF